MVERVAEATVNPLDSGNDAHSVESAASDFTRMLEDEARPRQKSEPSRNNRSRPSEPSEGDEPEDDVPDAAHDEDGQDPDDGDPILDGDAGDEPEEADEDADADKDEEDESEPDDEDDDDDDDLEKEYEITVNGEIVKAPLKEILAGYSREADYRQKTALLADERREVEEFAQATVAERQKYDSTLQTWIDLTAALEPSKEDWDRIKAADPNLYIQTKEQWDGVAAKVAEARAERDRVAAQAAEDEARNYAAYVKSQNEALAKAVPALANPKKAKAFREAIFTYGKAAGYTEDELMAGAVDARDVLTLYKAARYDEIVRSRKAGQRPARTAPKPSVSSRPRNVSKNGNSQGRRAARDADRRLARSGSVDDAAMAFTEMLKG